MKTTRQFIIVSFVCAALAVSAFAAEKKDSKPGLVQKASGQQYGMAGCGLGSILFGDQKGMIQIVSSTFNGSFGSQTFGITSGTSNCVDSSGGGRSASLFITANREALEKDIARGSGETVTNLSELMGCESQSFGTKLQQNYGKIFPSQKAGTDHVVDTILNIGQGCNTVG